ncbi:MAG: S-adenosylmethionine-diacylgycerolhomoserine-N-methyltransferase BtaB [Roseibaca calidilacus]|uniref:S-adenosylmethionine-diacylgycerolhomoserine-N-methlytransferase n=1 Tax=Roseibaca calidilacus TaxID=1666912 RepID=A0A0P7WCE8_9RHOB|nr:class I SAM-dependent methyltransferase [Roseibaca calidilacus]KPP95644.1 MAG: S-adenosylmethionine-diacylgycerolhomoserine-N-methyltransferase BtaB [Roseibaca calidilacus]CUX81955.1 S-adenosylmethionine-diacylgycerolhomoserine-N-methlytransferase [Roseibaca calidilacus]
MADTHHAALMDRTYRHQRLIYDATRAWFLLGRDHLIAHLDVPQGGSVLELACGTGRNLDLIGRRYNGSKLYGFDISEEMLRSARAKLGARATLAHGDACAFDANTLLGQARFDRIVLSYSLSMIPDWPRAVSCALDHLAAGGSLHIVDFGRQHRLPRLARRGLNAWLAKFHVTPRHDLDKQLTKIADARGMNLNFKDLFASYAQHAIITNGNG